MLGVVHPPVAEKPVAVQPIAVDDRSVIIMWISPSDYRGAHRMKGTFALSSGRSAGGGGQHRVHQVLHRHSKRGIVSLDGVFRISGAWGFFVNSECEGGGVWVWIARRHTVGAEGFDVGQ